MTRFLTTTRVDSSNVLQCLVGNFHKGQDSVILWGYSDRLELYREEPHGGLLLFHKQHTHDKLLKLGYLLGQPDGLQNEVGVSIMSVGVIYIRLSSRSASSTERGECQNY